MVATYKLLTWNVWFGHFQFNIRVQHILDIVLHIDPDIICFQEATPAFFRIIKDRDDIQELYDISSGEITGYGTISLAKKTLHASFEVIHLPSTQGRNLLITYFTTHKGGIAVANVHLESLNAHPIREQQLRIANAALRPASTAIIAGDFNFCAYRNFNPDPSLPLENDSLHRLVPFYVDLWPQLCPHHLGYTYDSTRNGMNRHKLEHMRYDRVLLRSHHWQGIEISLVGTEPINTTYQATGHSVCEGSQPRQYRHEPYSIRTSDMTWPSDHFGIVATLSAVQPSLQPSYGWEWMAAICGVIVVGLCWRLLRLVGIMKLS